MRSCVSTTKNKQTSSLLPPTTTPPPPRQQQQQQQLRKKMNNTNSAQLYSTSIEPFEDYIVRGALWNELPRDVKESISNNVELYFNAAKKYYVEHQTAYEQATIVQPVMNKRDYYTEMINHSKNNLRLYPYHLSNAILSELGILPFHYYIDMLFMIMKNEKSYDILPNFTAADVNQLIGIGRNQYIDIMNKVRSKKWVWRFNKSIVKEMLPTNPVKTMTIDYWWIVEPFPLSQNEFLKIYNQMEKEDENKQLSLAIATIKKEGKILACRLPFEPLLELYRRGLVYFHVPINSDDYIVVPPLKGFIMNRTPNDSFEKLLYDILVTLDERTSVKELASILEVNEDLVKTAVSVCCRLGFAKKKINKPHNLDETSEDQFHNSWAQRIDMYHEELKDSAPSNTSWIEGPKGLSDDVPQSKQKRIGFLFDSSLTAYLMMGNLAEGLKNHAVTLFEVGKMPDESMDDFLHELDQIKNCGEGEGEAQRYYKHAISLRSTLRFLRHNNRFGLNNTDKLNCDGGVDMIRAESLDNLDDGTKLRIIEQNFAVLIATAPIAPGTLTLPSCIPRYYGPPIPHVSTFWFKLYTYSCCKCGPPSILFRKGQRVRKLPKFLLSDCKVTIAGWEQEPSQINNRILLQVINESIINSPTLLQVFGEYNENQMFEIPFPFSLDLLDKKPEQEQNIDKTASSSVAQQETSSNPFSLGEEQDLIDLDADIDGLQLASNGTPTSPNSASESNRGYAIGKPSHEPCVDVVDTLTDDERNQIATIMDLLTDKLHLGSSFGCVKMLRTKAYNDPTRTIIYPMDISFGIPLSHSRINYQVCQVILDRDMLSLDNINQHSVNMKNMCKEFLEFIDEHLGPHTELKLEEMSHNIYPTQNVFFDGEKICDLDL